MKCPKDNCAKELVNCIYGDKWFYYCPSHGCSQDFDFPPEKGKIYRNTTYTV